MNFVKGKLYKTKESFYLFPCGCSKQQRSFFYKSSWVMSMGEIYIDHFLKVLCEDKIGYIRINDLDV